MSTARMIFVLSGLWLSATLTPSLIDLMDADTTVVVSNPNDEEHHDQGKNDLDEEKLLEKGMSDYFLAPQLGDSNDFVFHPVNGPGTTMDVILPPPEKIS